MVCPIQPITHTLIFIFTVLVGLEMECGAGRVDPSVWPRMPISEDNSRLQKIEYGMFIYTRICLDIHITDRLGPWSLALGA
jgi:hypothetical protein